MVCNIHILQNLLQHRLRLTIGVRAFAQRTGFRNRNLRRIAINSCRRAENNIFAAMLAHHVEQHKRTVDIIIIILPRLLHALAYGLQSCEMNAAVKAVLRKNLFQSLTVADIRFIERNSLPGDFFHTLQGQLAGVDQIIYHHNAVTGAEQLNDSMRADKAGAACYQYFH